LITEGREAAAPLLEEATRTFTEETAAEASRRWGWLMVVPTYALWDEKSAHAICAKQLAAVREAGALGRLTLDLATFDLLAVRCGDFADAEAAIAEADALSKATGVGMRSVSAMRLAAFRGDDEAEALIESVRQEASAAGQGVVVELTEWLLAVPLQRHRALHDAVAAACAAGDTARARSSSQPGRRWSCSKLQQGATTRRPRASHSSESLRRRRSLAPTRHRESSRVPVRL
jgi:hypothetical protein